MLHAQHSLIVHDTMSLTFSGTQQVKCGIGFLLFKSPFPRSCETQITNKPKIIATKTLDRHPELSSDTNLL